jgi:hypothetical protein
MPPTEDEYVLLDAGVFIGALLTGDSQHAEARPIAAAIVAGINSVFTYDAEDWESFEGEGLSIAGPRRL